MMPAPRDARALFELLLWYDERAGLYPLLSRLDVAGQRPQQAHYSVLGTYPDRSAPMRNTRYYPRDHLNELLLGDEFQAGLLSRFAEAYSDKRRLIFVHVPKCAGTDLSNKLKTRYPWVDYNIMDTDWTTKRAMLRHLSRLAVQLRFADCLYLCGHGGLDFYMDHHLIRPIDEIFTVVRNPLEIMVSQINYVLTRFSQDATKGEVGPDTREWLGLIGRDSLPEIDFQGFRARHGEGHPRESDYRHAEPTLLLAGGAPCRCRCGPNSADQQRHRDHRHGSLQRLARPAMEHCLQFARQRLGEVPDPRHPVRRAAGLLARNHPGRHEASPGHRKWIGGYRQGVGVWPRTPIRLARMNTSYPSILLYDWDNTLVDGWAGITAALNAVFDAFAMPHWTVADTRARVRVSLRDSFPVMFGADWERARDIFYATLEAQHLHHVAPMPGAAEALAAGAAWPQGVVSNKAGKFLRAEVAHLGWAAPFRRGGRRRRCVRRQAGSRADPAGARPAGPDGRSLGLVSRRHGARHGGGAGGRGHRRAGRRCIARWWD